MRETIQNYFEKTKQYPNYYSNEDFSIICDDIKKEIEHFSKELWQIHSLLLKRTSETGGE